MKAKNLYLVLITSFLTSAHASVSSGQWSVSNVPASGLTDITFPITIIQADHFSGYYFFQQFPFVGTGEVGYTGIQPRPDASGKAVLHGVFSSFIQGTTTTDGNCSPGADGGPGVSCAVEWNGVYGRQYNFEIKTSGNRLWNGTAVDTVTGQHIHIGSYTLPSQTQGIKGSQLGFVEWYHGLADCARLPYQKSFFGDPFTTHPGSVGTQGRAYEYGGCIDKVAFHTEKVTGGFENNCGFVGQRG